MGPILVSIAALLVGVALLLLGNGLLGTLIGISPLGVTGALASGVVLGSLYGLVPAFGHAVGFDVSDTARFVSAFILGGLLLQWPIGRLSDRTDRRLIIVAVAAMLSVFSAVTVVAAGESRFALWPLAIAIGSTAFTLYPLSVAHANDRIGPEDMVAASGGLLLSYGAGATAGPLISSFVMWWMGPAGLFVVTGAAALAVAAFSVYRMTRRATPAEDAQERFQPLPRTTPAALELDPRGAESVAADGGRAGS